MFVCFFKEEENDGGVDKVREGKRTPLRKMDINLKKKISINLIICLKKRAILCMFPIISICISLLGLIL